MAGKRKDNLQPKPDQSGEDQQGATVRRSRRPNRGSRQTTRDHVASLEAEAARQLAAQPLDRELQMPEILVHAAAIGGYLRNDLAGPRKEDFRGLGEERVPQNGTAAEIAQQIKDQYLEGVNVSRVQVGGHEYLKMTLAESQLSPEQQRVALARLNVLPVDGDRSLKPIMNVVFTDGEGFNQAMREGTTQNIIVDRSLPRSVYQDRKRGQQDPRR